MSSKIGIQKAMSPMSPKTAVSTVVTTIPAVLPPVSYTHLDVYKRQILITTKRGKTGVAEVSYDGYVGVQNLYKIPTILNAQELSLIHI